MKKNYAVTKVLQACLLFFMIITTNVFGQVGIGTITPNASSVLDVSSTTQGMLTPRMTTVQRTAISSPADGLMVYDTDLKSFFHYNTAIASWNVINSATTGRSKFKRIKSTDVLATVLAAEKTAGGGSKYLLDSETLYEINGAINVDLPIELNNAYVAGLDSGEDKLIKANGDLFTGTTGGSIRVLTVVASGASGNVFNITGAGNQNLVFRDCIVANSANVGLIKGFSLVFVSIVQYVGNANGIIYENINKLLINNAGWFGGGLPLGNSGTYEKIVGTFEQVAKQGGFSEVSGSSIGFDVSGNPIINGDAVIESVVFTGSNAAGYVKPYTIGTYTGYNFNNNWNIRCAGIPTEGDSFASGNLYLDRTLTSPTLQMPSTTTAYKIPGTTVPTNLFRMDGATTNRIVYLGKKRRTFTVSASVSFEGGTGSADLLFYFVKFAVGGSPFNFVTSSETFIDSNTASVQSFPVSGTVTLSTGEYVELYGQRLNGTNKIFTFRSYNISMK
ncbi:hypothetical protein SAMN05444395_1036 [Flavobacterium fryxellicola]|uniref:Cell wall anchor protein n=1 Tax=Flavobacterium fryxellicola TaxID=249352 RepID=A0A167X9V4_9FLAO|nr:hypothetical protein [Flavobacterium fryxellicola]OAB28149.1 hypothetical protein FBFR_09925 [Flavobacterium fryxellicola]SHN63330.1 hypothetical protein SAMN05444395_1036 [Flavobacterium fryxellicola]